MDWELFMGHSKARPLIWLLGRFGARVFYCIVGAVFIVGGLSYAFGLKI